MGVICSIFYGYTTEIITNHCLKDAAMFANPKFAYKSDDLNQSHSQLKSNKGVLNNSVLTFVNDKWFSQ